MVTGKQKHDSRSRFNEDWTLLRVSTEVSATHPKWPSCTVTLSFAWCDAEFKNVTKALRIEEIFCVYLSTKWVDLRDTGNKLPLSVNSMIAVFVIYLCGQNRRGRDFVFSSCLIFFLWHFSNILVNFPLHFFIIIFTSPALITFNLKLKWNGSSRYVFFTFVCQSTTAL